MMDSWGAAQSFPEEVRMPGLSIFLELKVVQEEKKGKCPCSEPLGPEGHLDCARACTESNGHFFPVGGLWAPTLH